MAEQNATKEKVKKRLLFNYQEVKREYCTKLKNYSAADSIRPVMFNRKILKHVVNTMNRGEKGTNSEIWDHTYQWQIENKYEIITENDKSFCIKKREKQDDPVVKYIPVEDSFDILAEIHRKNRHCCRERMLQLLKQKFIIPDFCVDLLLMCCNVCVKGYKKKVIMNPITEHNLIVQANIINMEKTPDCMFSHILVYVDKSTSFTLLKPLMRMCPLEISLELLKIFLDFGPPLRMEVLQPEMEIFAMAMSRIKTTCSHCVIPVDCNKTDVAFKTVRSIQIVRYIQDWMSETGSSNWGLGCHILQWKLNNKKIEQSDKSQKDVQTPFSKVFRNSTNNYNKCIRLPTVSNLLDCETHNVEIIENQDVEDVEIEQNEMEYDPLSENPIPMETQEFELNDNLADEYSEPENEAIEIKYKPNLEEISIEEHDITATPVLIDFTDIKQSFKQENA